MVCVAHSESQGTSVVFVGTMMARCRLPTEGIVGVARVEFDTLQWSVVAHGLAEEAVHITRRCRCARVWVNGRPIQRRVRAYKD